MFTEWRIARLEKKLGSARAEQQAAKIGMHFDNLYRVGKINMRHADEFIAATKHCGRLENKIRKLKAKL